MFRRISLIVLLTLFLLIGTTGAAVSSGLHQGWSELLDRFVEDGTVDYQGFKKNEAELDRYLAILDMTDPETLSESDQLAFYINGYNAYTVKLILDNFKNGMPPLSIRKIGGIFTSPWGISFVRIGGKTYSLDEVEHEIIRPRFGEPRIHFAVNCASKSCPPLITVAYEGETIDEQLEKSTRDFLMNRSHNYLEGSTLYLSSIFKWYGEDFQDDPASFVRAHSGGELAEQLRNLAGEVRVKYLDYDWSLNGTTE
jgi:hypothetical protein